MSINRAVLIGRPTKDPELRYTPAGVAVTQFTLAVDRPFQTNGEKEADFIPCVAWRQLAETTANYLRKGRLCAVEGRIQVRNYENNEGKRVYVTEVICDNVRFLESVKRDEAQEGRSGSQSSGGSSNNSTARLGNTSKGTAAGDDTGRPIDISDDDLPF